MKLKLSEIITKMAVLDEIDNPTKEDEKRLEELRAEFDKYLELPTTEPMLSNTGESDSEPEIKLYNRSNLDELRSYIRSKDKFGISEPVSAGKFIRGLITGSWENAMVERRALTTVTSGGGYLIPELISSILIPLALNKSQCFKAGAFTIPMESKSLTIPRIIESPETEWKEESVKYSAGEGMQFSGITLEAHTLMALVKMSVELAQDGVNVEQTIEDAMTDAIALALDLAVLNGAGGLSPTGILQTEGILEEDLENDPIASFDFLSNAYFKLEAENEIATALIAPSDLFRDLDLLKNNDLDRLQPPLSYEGTQQKPSYQKLSSNQLINSAVLGDFTKVVIGMRSDFQIDVTNKAGDSFEKLEVWIRCFLRADVGIKREKAFCKIANYGELAS